MKGKKKKKKKGSVGSHSPGGNKGGAGYGY